MKCDKFFIGEIIDLAKQEKLLFQSEVLSGFSSKSLTALLQHLAKAIDKNECYLEVGVYQGLSLLSVAKSIKEKKITAFGIDNFSQFDKEGRNFALVEERAHKVKATNYKIVNLDFEDALLNLEQHIGEKKVGLYFIDGPHDYRSQLLCLEQAKKHLAKNAVIVIDDCNYLHVRQATFDFLRLNPEFRLVFQAYADMHPHQVGAKTNKWWDGIHLICRSEEYEAVLPEVDTAMMFEEHRMMTVKYPFQQYEAGLFAAALRPFRPVKLVRRFFRLWKAVHRSKKMGDYDYLNTFSRGLKEVNTAAKR